MPGLIAYPELAAARIIGNALAVTVFEAFVRALRIRQRRNEWPVGAVVAGQTKADQRTCVANPDKASIGQSSKRGYPAEVFIAATQFPCRQKNQITHTALPRMRRVEVKRLQRDVLTVVPIDRAHPANGKRCQQQQNQDAGKFGNHHRRHSRLANRTQA